MKFKEDRILGRIKPFLYHKVISQTFGYILGILAVFGYYYSSRFMVITQKLQVKWGQTFFDKNKKSDSPELTEIKNEYFYYKILENFILFLISIPSNYCNIWLARKAHSRMFFSLVHLEPTNFLQSTPNGVILNRFSPDIGMLDNGVTAKMLSIAQSILSFLVLSMTLSKGIPIYSALIPFFVFLVVAIRVRNRYIRALREVQRLYFISKSPVIGQCNSSISGGPVIRTSKQAVAHLKARFETLVDGNTSNTIMSFALKKWFNLQTQFILTFIGFIPLYTLLLWTRYTTEDVDKESVAFFGFANKFSSKIFGIISGLCAVEVSFVSIERLDHFENLDLEKGY